MTVRVVAESEVMHDVADVLLQHLSPAKVVRFWASWHAEHGDYLSWRDEQFGTETVATLYDKIAAYQASLAPLIDNRNADKG